MEKHVIVPMLVAICILFTAPRPSRAAPAGVDELQQQLVDQQSDGLKIDDELALGPDIAFDEFEQLLNSQVGDKLYPEDEVEHKSDSQELFQYEQQFLPDEQFIGEERQNAHLTDPEQHLDPVSLAVKRRLEQFFAGQMWNRLFEAASETLSQDEHEDFNHQQGLQLQQQY